MSLHVHTLHRWNANNRRQGLPLEGVATHRCRNTGAPQAAHRREGVGRIPRQALRNRRVRQGVDEGGHEV